MGEAVWPNVSMTAAQRVSAGKRQSLKTMISLERGYKTLEMSNECVVKNANSANVNDKNICAHIRGC